MEELKRKQTVAMNAHNVIHRKLHRLESTHAGEHNSYKIRFLGRTFLKEISFSFVCSVTSTNGDKHGKETNSHCANIIPSDFPLVPEVKQTILGFLLNISVLDVP